MLILSCKIFSPETARLKADLEKSERERAEAENALKNSENAKREAERRAEILRRANERHAGRKASLVERIKNSYHARHPVSVIKARKCETIEQVFDSIKTLDDANAQVRKRKFFRNGDLTFGGVSGSRTNGATNMRGKVLLAKDVRDGVQSAFRKIATGKSADITEDEARYIGTMWHEMTHNRHVIDLNNFANNEYLPRISRKRDAMEMMNEYVARRTLPEFYEFIGIKKTPYPKFMESRSNTGYNAWVLGLRETISFLGINEDKFLAEAKKNLFEKAYTKQKEFTAETLVSFVPGLQKKEANKILEGCLNLYNETSVKSFKTSVLEPIKNRLDGKKI